MKFEKLKRGFTLIELLVVISIIGILVSVGTVSYQKSTKLARDSRRKTDLEQIRQALESYRAEKGVYPCAASVATNTEAGSCIATALEPAYIAAVPLDPKSGVTGVDTKYNFYKSGNINEYSLCAALEIDPGQTLNRCDAGACGPGPDSCNYEITNP